MPKAEVESYREHSVWESLRLKIAWLSQAAFSQAEVEEGRIELHSWLSHAMRSRDNVLMPGLYRPALDELQGLVNQIQPDEHQFNQYLQNSRPALAGAIRQLPGPQPKGLAPAYVKQLDEAVALREGQIADLKRELETLQSEITKQEQVLQAHKESIATQQTSVTSARDQIETVARETSSTLTSQYQEQLSAWTSRRDETSAQFDRKMTDQLNLLIAAAQVGQRLVEHAAGSLTATDWTARAKRERLSGFRLRLLAFAFAAAGLALAYYILDRAVKQDFDLTVGDGILRAAGILAVIAVGGYFGAESRRHYKEADTAEEVATAMVAIEPFYAGASHEDREAARNAVGDTIFVKNVLSRFTGRDAGRHNEAVNSQDLGKIIDELTAALRSSNRPPSP